MENNDDSTVYTMPGGFSPWMRKHLFDQMMLKYEMTQEFMKKMPKTDGPSIIAASHTPH